MNKQEKSIEASHYRWLKLKNLKRKLSNQKIGMRYEHYIRRI